METNNYSLAASIVLDWKNFDTSNLNDILADDFEYFSYAVATPIIGKEKYIEYLNGKFKTFQKENISYSPEIINLSDGQYEFAIILRSKPYEENPPSLLMKIEHNKIKRLVMRPVHMFSLQDLNDETKSNYIIKKICETIHSWVDDERKKLKLPSEELEWYQSWPILDNAPAFQHMCFRLGNNVYSLYIKIFGQFFTSEENLMCDLWNVRQENQIKECKNNNLIPIDLHIDVNGLCKPTPCEIGTDKMIEISAGNLDDIVFMSEWEINATAVNNALRNVYSQNPSAVSYTNVLTFKPQIFYAVNGQEFFVYVDGHKANENPGPLNLDQIENQKENAIGQFYDFGFVSNIFSEGNQISRRGEILFRSDELIPISEALEKFGGEHSGFYPIQ